MTRNSDIAAKKVAQVATMLQVPIGGVCLVRSETNRSNCLYIRVDRAHMACHVTTGGGKALSDDRMRIRQPWLAHDSVITLLPEEEQARRIMLAAHGLGLRAIEEWVPEATFVVQHPPLT